MRSVHYNIFTSCTSSKRALEDEEKFTLYILKTHLYLHRHLLFHR